MRSSGEILVLDPNKHNKLLEVRFEFTFILSSKSTMTANLGPYLILIHARDFAHHTTVGISPKSHTVMTTGTPSSRVRIIVVMVAFIIIEIKTHTKKKKITRNK